MFMTRCADITIPNGSNVSNTVLATEQYIGAYVISLSAPATLDSDTFNIEVSDDPEATAPTWNTLNDGTSDVAAPSTASKTINYPAFANKAFRIKKSATTVAASRTWRMGISEFGGQI